VGSGWSAGPETRGEGLTGCGDDTLPPGRIHLSDQFPAGKIGILRRAVQIASGYISPEVVRRPKRAKRRQYVAAVTVVFGC
jgi:hypothetical protein